MAIAKLLPHESSLQAQHNPHYIKHIHTRQKLCKQLKTNCESRTSSTLQDVPFNACIHLNRQ